LLIAFCSAARLGDTERAFDLLNKAVENRDPDFLLFFVDPVFNDLRADARFEHLFAQLYASRE